MTLSPIRIGTLIVAVLALIFHVVGFATNHWLEADVSQLGGLSFGGVNFNAASSGAKSYSGLWKSCGSLAGITQCKSREEALAVGLKAIGLGDIEFVDHKWRAIQALETIGLILLVLVCVGIAISVCVEGARVQTVSVFLGSAGLLAAASILVGVIILGQGYVHRPLVDVSWSLALSVIGGVLAFVAGILVFICLQRERHSSSITRGVVMSPMNYPQKSPGHF